MNLTNQPVYQRGQPRKRSNHPTRAQRERWQEIRSLGCSVCGASNPEIHHALTGAGGRKDHDKVFALCMFHHRGGQGIHTLSRRVWEAEYGTEEVHLERVAELLTLQR